MLQLRTLALALAVAAAAALTSGLSSCSAANPESASAAPVSTPAAPTAKADALLVAVQGFSDSFLTGDVGVLTSYLHPDCADQQQTLIDDAGAAPEEDKATRLTVDTVEMSADSGRIGNWHVAADAPAKVKERVQTTAEQQAQGMPWRYVAGEWQFRPATCGGAS